MGLRLRADNAFSGHWIYALAVGNRVSPRTLPSQPGEARYGGAVSGSSQPRHRGLLPRKPNLHYLWRVGRLAFGSRQAGR